MSVQTLVFFLMLTLVCCQSPSNSEQVSGGKTWEISSQQEWLKGSGLINVESIIYDESEDVFYASNGIDYAPGVTGFISKISPEGDLLELKWVDSLSRPTGMVILDSVLYAADVDVLVAINTKSGSILGTYSEPVPNSGLNDVCIDLEKEVYVSASAIHSVLKLVNGKLEIWAQDEDKLQWANGLVAQDDRIVVAGLSLSSVNVKSREVSPLEIKPLVKDFDGIVSDGSGGYFLTTVENSGLYRISEKGETVKMMGGDAYFGDLSLTSDPLRLHIPRGIHEENQYFITVFELAKKTAD